MKKPRIIKPLTKEELKIRVKKLKEEKAKYGRTRTAGEELWFKILKDSKKEKKMKTGKVRKTSKKDQKDKKIEALETELKDTQYFAGVLFITLLIVGGVLLFKHHKNNYRDAVRTSCEYLEKEIKDHPKVRWVNYDVFNETCTVTSWPKGGSIVFNDYNLEETELLRKYFRLYGVTK